MLIIEVLYHEFLQDNKSNHQTNIMLEYWQVMVINIQLFKIMICQMIKSQNGQRLIDRMGKLDDNNENNLYTFKFSLNCKKSNTPYSLLFL